MARSASRSPVCPECGQLDAVRKVSAIISQETTHSTSSTKGVGMALGSGEVVVGGASTKHRSQSELCQRLACPDKPKKSAVAGCFVACVALTALMLLGSLIGLTKPEEKDRKTGLAGLFVVTPLFALLSYGLWRAKPKAEAKDERKLLRWEEVSEFWERAYYCGRCDGVFAPGDDGVETPEKAFSL